MYKTLVLPLIATLLLHASLVLVFLIDWDGSDSRVRKVQPSFVKARLVTMEKPKAKAKVKKVVKKRPPPKKAAVAKKTQPAAQKKQADEAKKRQRVEQQRQAEKQAELERQRQDRLAREAEQELAQAIADEELQQQAESEAELANSYIGLIIETIQSRWNRPPSARNNMETELIIQLVPTGEVVSVDIVKSSGNDAFDRSAQKAVWKAERFPELQNLPSRVFEKNFRRLRIKFRPEDLRL